MNVDVVIPVHGQLAPLRRCVGSVLEGSERPSRLILIDDASPDAETRRYVEELATIPGCLAFRNRQNRGFVSTVNRALRMTRGDIVVLNSDTVVTRGWLRKLASCARSRPRVASVTPLTNNGTICAVPRWNVANDVPPSYDLEEYGRLIEALSARRYPELPTAVGFCMYLTREAIEAVGDFDELTFSRGYGEENDWCVRASERGYVHLLDDATFVYHEGGASFGAEKKRLAEENYRRLTAKHPGYDGRIGEFIRRNPLEPIQRAVRTALGRERGSLRVFVLVHSPLHLAGGTEAHTLDLVTTVPRVEFVVAYPSAGSVIVEEYRRGERVGREEFSPDRRDAGSARRWWAWLLRRSAADVLHVQHLMGSESSVLPAAKDLGLPIVFVWHDYFLLCRSYTLVDDSGSFCEWCVDLSVCDRCLANRFGYSAGFQAAWRRIHGSVVESIDAHVFPSRACFEGVRRVFPVTAEKAHWIPHGHWPFAPAIDRLTADGRLRVGYVGTWSEEKGCELFAAAARALGSREFEWHAFGAVRPGLGDTVPETVALHGPYAREEISHLLRESRIDIAVLPSIWPETFSYTLSECWAAGVPVVGSDLGAIGQRLREEGGGWVFDPARPESLTVMLRRLATDPDELRTKTDAVRGLKPLRVATMAAAYAALYRRLARRLGADETRATASASATA